MDHYRVRGAARADRRHSLLPSHAPAGRVARPARLGRGAHAAVGGWDDCGGLDHVVGRLAGVVLPWALLVAGSVASLAANVAVAQPTVAGRVVIAAWRSFALMGAYELLMRQVRRSAAGGGSKQPRKPGSQASHRNAGDPAAGRSPTRHSGPGGRNQGPAGHGGAGREFQRQAWHWALAHRAGDGSLPSGREIARQYGRHERWGRLVKRSGTTGEFSGEPAEPALRLVGQQLSSATGE